MPRWLKALIIAATVFVVLIAIGSIMQREEEAPATTTPSATSQPAGATPQCPVANTTHSFCFVKNGKAYYFAIEGWELPTINEIEPVIASYSSISYDFPGLYIWLKVKTNLKDVSVSGYAPFGEILKEVLGSSFLDVKRSEDEILIPCKISTKDDSLRVLLNAKMLKLEFGTNSERYGLPTEGCFNGVCFEFNKFYLNYAPPPTALRVLGIKGRCLNSENCLYNITFELRNGYVLLDFYFDEKTGSKDFARFPVNIYAYVNKNGVLEVVDEYDWRSLEVIPPIPSTAVDVWKEPEHRYIVTIIPSGLYTLTFRTSVIYPQPLLRGEKVFVGTRWGLTRLEPKLEVLKILNINTSTTYEGLTIDEVNVLLRNSGSIPIVIVRYVTEGYAMLQGILDSTNLVYIAQPEVVINPGETVLVSLIPKVDGNVFLDVKIRAEDLDRAHRLEIRSIYANASSELLIPPLSPSMAIEVIEDRDLDYEYGSFRLSVRLSVTNNWVVPVEPDWIRVYLDENPLQRFDYMVSHGVIKPDEAGHIDVDIQMKLSRGFTDLYKILQSKHFRICLGVACVEVPVKYMLSETVDVGSLTIKIINVTVTKAIAIKNDLFNATDYYEAPEGHQVLVVFVQVRNMGYETAYLSSIGSFSDSAVVTERGLYECVDTSRLKYVNGIVYDNVVEISVKHLWSDLRVYLEPGESYTIALTFLVPENSNIQYLLLRVEFQTIVFSVSGYQS